MYKKLLLVLLIGSPLLAGEDELSRPTSLRMKTGSEHDYRRLVDEVFGRILVDPVQDDDCSSICGHCCCLGIIVTVGVPVMVFGLADAGVRAAADKVTRAPDAVRKLIRKHKQKTD